MRTVVHAVTLGLALVGPALAAESALPGARVEPEVLAQLAGSTSGRTSVLIMLTPVAFGPRAQLDAQQAAVHARQQRVLDTLLPGDLELRHRYRTFAGLSGHVDVPGLQRLAAHPEVVAIGVNGRARAYVDESVPFLGADVLHGYGVTGAGTTVAVLDSGIDSDHPDLVDDVAPGAWHFLDDGADVGPGAEDGNSHGSNVSGIITSGGVVGPPGVAPDAKILAVKVLSDSGGGWLSDITAGIDHVTSVAGDHDKLRVINMSLGTFELYSACPADDETVFNMAMEAACAAAKAAGITSFASSGNQGSCGTMSAPAALTSCVAVAATYHLDLGPEPDSGTYQDAFGASFGDCQDLTTGADVVTCFSNQSPCNELAAPGRLIDAAIAGGGVAAYTGTSMASPHVAALAALLHQYGEHTPDALVTLMKDTGEPTTDGCGSGPNPTRVNALAALEASPWAELVTSGLPGTTTPVLTASGVLLAAAPVLLDATHLPPGSTGFLVIGVVDLSASFKGGTLVPSPDIVVGLPTGQGSLPIGFAWPAGIPSDTRFWVQVWAQDAGGPQGYSATNAVMGETF